MCVPGTVAAVRREVERAGGPRVSRRGLLVGGAAAAATVGPLAYKGGPSSADFHFPGFGLEAAMWLAEHRDVTGLGVDTLSIDPATPRPSQSTSTFWRPTGTASRT